MSNNSSLITDRHVLLDDVAISAVVALVGVFGLASNSAAIVAVMTNPVLKNAFGLLCLSHSIANFGVLLVFTFWVTPMTLIKSKLSSTLVGKLFGMVNIMFWDVCVYSHLAISLNRLIAITLPYRAAHLLTFQKTLILVGSAWFLGFCHVIAYFWTDVCFIYYEPKQWIWIFADTVCGHIISKFTDFYTTLAVLVIILILDCTTLFKLRMNNKVSSNQSSSSSDTVQRRRRNTEIRFFWQTLYQNALFFYEISNFYYLCDLFGNQWAVFFTSTFPWEICHAMDGMIIVLFHFRWSHIRRAPANVNSTAAYSRRNPSDRNVTE